VTVGGLYVTAPEVLGKPKVVRQAEYDFGVRSCLTDARHHRCADEDLEAEP
jgi:hypothetical protein